MAEYIDRDDVLGEILFSDSYLPMLKAGHKTTTIRKGIRNYPIGVYIAYNTAKTEYVFVRVTKTAVTTFGALTEQNAKTDGFTSLSELKRDLLKFYPNLTDDSPMTLVTLDMLRESEEDNDG